MFKYHGPEQLGEDRVYFSLQLRVHHKRTSWQELEVEATGEKCLAACLSQAVLHLVPGSGILDWQASGQGYGSQREELLGMQALVWLYAFESGQSKFFAVSMRKEQS